MPSPMKLSVHIEDWQTKSPFRIAGHVWNTFKMVVVELADGSHVGQGEGLPIFYLGQTADDLLRQVESVALEIERGLGRDALLQLMPPSGARNAIDCALWELEAKNAGKSIWSVTGIDHKPVATAFTIGIEDTAEAMAARAVEASIYPILKIKVNADQPVERVADDQQRPPVADRIECARHRALGLGKTGPLHPATLFRSQIDLVLK